MIAVGFYQLDIPDRAALHYETNEGDCGRVAWMRVYEVWRTAHFKFQISERKAEKFEPFSFMQHRR